MKEVREVMLSNNIIVLVLFSCNVQFVFIKYKKYIYIKISYTVLVIKVIHVHECKV